MITDYYKTGFIINRISSSIDSDNFDIQTEVPYIISSGSIEPLSGNERIFNSKYEAYTTHRLFCNILDIKENDTIIIDSYSYNIDLIQNYRNHHLEIILLKIE